jgi:hypothetical protein
MSNDENEVYSDGAGVGPWQTLAMTRRDFPKGNVFGHPGVGFSVLPDYIANEYYVHVTGLSEVMLDYFVEAEDSLGIVKRSPIQHVWVGDASGSSSHVMDGDLDTTSTLIASSGGINLYADWDGEHLYVATEGVGVTTGWDHFVVVGVDFSTPVSAPWAKTGTVADRTLYLGNEDSNNWCGWFDGLEILLSDGVACASGSFLEGLVRPETHLGTPLPAGIYLAVTAYQSPDAGALSGQAPAGNGNGNVDAAEYVYFPLGLTGIDPEPRTATFPARLLLLPAHPNPFSSTTDIRFSLANSRELSLGIYDVSGRRVRTLGGGVVSEGRHSLPWDGKDEDGLQVSPGIYVIRADGSGSQQSQKVVYLR